MSYKIKAILCASMILPCFMLGSCGADTQPVESAVSSEVSSSEEDKTEHLKKAYKLLCDSSVTMENISNVIQNAWHFGIYEDNPKLYKLADATGISEQALTDIGAKDFYLDEFSYCVNYCILAMQRDEAYYQTAKNKIDEAKKEIQQATDDLNHYEDMKNFYSSSLSYYEWLESPTGNFDQATTSINEYENKLKEFKNDMEFDFG